MPDDLFLITGGGTGAKVAESLVHLCAAGMGPERLHLLLIDSDTSNGNLRRTRETIRSYGDMQKWPWSFSTRASRGGFGEEGTDTISLFGTQVEKYEITEQIKTVHQGGLETAVETSEMDDVLDLLYDEDEQRATCEDGFRARPNLGCLLMSEHLNKRLTEEASGFVNDLENALSAGGRIPVVVAASVFGGTGASLFPVIQNCIEGALKNQQAASNIEWGAVQLLPHYQPREKKESVDPDRFFLDSSSALQYYSTTQNGTSGNGSAEGPLFDGLYVIGSDNPGRNTVETVLGSGGQANPPYFEEVIAGLAVLDVSRRQDGRPVRIYDPNTLNWESLPYGDTDSLQHRVALLLHLSAFYLQPSTRSTESQMEKGLGEMTRDVSGQDLQMYGWYDTILDEWADRTQGAYASAEENRKVQTLRSSVGDQSISSMNEKAAEFFGRHLLWTETALKGEGLSFVDYEEGSYARIYDAMSEVEPDEIDHGRDGSRLQPEQDNALARALRTAAAALTYDHRRTNDKGLLSRISLFDEDSGIPLRITKQQVRQALRSFNRSDVETEYTKTRPGA